MHSALGTTASTGGIWGLPALSDSVGSASWGDIDQQQAHLQQIGAKEPDPTPAFGAFMFETPIVSGQTRYTDRLGEAGPGEAASTPMIQSGAVGIELSDWCDSSAVASFKTGPSTSPGGPAALSVGLPPPIPAEATNELAGPEIVPFHDRAPGKQGWSSAGPGVLLEEGSDPGSLTNGAKALSSVPPASGIVNAILSPIPGTVPDPVAAEAGIVMTAGHPEGSSRSCLGEETAMIPPRLAGPGPSATLGDGMGQVSTSASVGDEHLTETGEGPTLRLVATKAESLWHGRLQCQGEGHSAAVSDPVRSVREALATDAVPTAPLGRELSGDSVDLPQPLSLEPERLALSETDLPPLTGSTAQTLTSSRNLSAPVPPSAALNQLAAETVLMRSLGQSGMVEVALSPVELGRVRLRLEIDPKDPDRMIVHLAFDRPDTLELFRRNAEQLHEAIRAAGYTEASLDFGQSGTGDPAQGDQNQSGRRPASNPVASVPLETEHRIAADETNSLRPGETIGLNLRI